MKLIIKSPFNYPGNKYKQIPQLLKIFPKNINTFVDLFTGGGDVAINVEAQQIIANDINTPIIEIMQSFQEYSTEEIFAFIDRRIKEFNLSRTNEEGYIRYRELYNTNIEYHTPLDLFTITRFGFNHFIRFNNKMQLNTGFGRNRCDFNSNMRNNTLSFCTQIQEVMLLSEDFRDFNTQELTQNDFLYVDPPYLISNADYNTGKTAKLSWKQEDDIALQNYLNNASTRWAMSNFLAHKGLVNEQLEDWALSHNYNIYNIKSDYTKLTKKIDRTDNPTIEVVITNYNLEE